MPYMKKTSKGERKDDPVKSSKGGKYTRVGPVSPHVVALSAGNVVRHPTTLRRAEHSSSGRDRSARSLSVPSLHSTTDTRTKYSPPLSPPKPRSRSVRDPTTAAKKSHSFRKMFKLFGSHSELENGAGLWATDGQQTVGTYRPLGDMRPKSMGEYSDCSSVLSRENSLRDSSRSRLREGVFIGGRQASTDSNDYERPISMPYMPRADMTRSNSSTSLKNLHTKPGPPDTRYFSIAGVPSSFGESSEYGYRSGKGRLLSRQGTSEEQVESGWEDSRSFLFMDGPVLPSHPEYRQVAHDLMSADPRRMSDVSIDPRRVSNDSGVESLSASKHNRSSVPTTPIAPSFVSTGAQSVGTSSPEIRPSTPHTPHGYLSQESSHSTLSGHEVHSKRHQLTHWPTQEQEDTDSAELPPGWELVKSSRYGTYYVNHNNKTAMYQHPIHAHPPPPYNRPHQYADEETRRRTPARSHSHRSTQSHRVLDHKDSLPRRSKSFRNPEMIEGGVSHERQLSTMTFVPPSPYQVKEIPQWIKEYVEKPFGSEVVLKLQTQWRQRTHEELTEVDTMIKRLFKKASEQVVRNYEYYRVALQQEIDERARSRKKPSIQQKPSYSPQRPMTFRYPSPPLDRHSPPPHMLHHPNSYHSLTDERPHAYHTLTNERPHPFHSLTDERPHAYHTLTNERPHPFHSLTDERPHAYHTLHDERPHPHAYPSLTDERPFLPRVNSRGKTEGSFAGQNGTIKSKLSEEVFHTLDETFV